MTRVKITEEQYKHFLYEDVYVNALDTKKKKANLTYQKNGGSRNKGNKMGNDMLKTDKMDANNSDTYEVPLKGGIVSYNITSIKGQEVMHYFKRHFNKMKTEININNETYELMMQDNEFKDFIDQFVNKVDNVISYCVENYQSDNKNIKFTQVSIYPVPSSSTFNKAMAQLMQHYHFNNIPKTQIINDALLKKDLSKLEKDNDFINKNSHYYNTQQYKSNKLKSTTIQHVDTELNKLNVLKKAQNYIEEMNNYVEQILKLWYRRENIKKQNRLREQLAELYIQYINTKTLASNVAVYNNLIDNRESKVSFGKIAQAVKYTKGPSVDVRTDEIWEFIKPLIRNQKNINNKPIQKEELIRWEPVKFQIKNLPDNVRLGLKNYYNADQEVFKQEQEKIQNSVFVVFDDNVSGGATLSDICMQLKNIGIEHIIPITFGEMSKKYSMGVLQINQPENGYDFS